MDPFHKVYTSSLGLMRVSLAAQRQINEEVVSVVHREIPQYSPESSISMVPSVAAILADVEQTRRMDRRNALADRDARIAREMRR